jgi:hypothetical protein
MYNCTIYLYGLLYWLCNRYVVTVNIWMKICHPNCFASNSIKTVHNSTVMIYQSITDQCLNNPLQITKINVLTFWSPIARFCKGSEQHEGPAGCSWAPKAQTAFGPSCTSSWPLPQTAFPRFYHKRNVEQNGNVLCVILIHQHQLPAREESLPSGLRSPSAQAATTRNDF